jgi:epoxyqueuosine reductase
VALLSARSKTIEARVIDVQGRAGGSVFSHYTGQQRSLERMNTSTPRIDSLDLPALLADMRRWGQELGFSRLGVARIDLAADEAHFLDWLRAGFSGEMAYMSRHGRKRSRPAELLPGTVSCVSVRMDYWPAEAANAEATLADPNVAYVSRYALGRDYHKLMRARLQRLCDRIESVVGSFGHRVFTDSAPVLEKALARNSGLGWIGKHTNLIDRDSGSYFFLGEIYVDLDLPDDTPSTAHCGSCCACMPACPTGAIVAPYRLDARLCISYLTIELSGSIPLELRRAIGNRIYGCDDCQLVCPWNKFARPTAEGDFAVRHGLDHPQLVELFSWSEAQFLDRTRGSAIRRIGFERWLRNIAVALGNAPTSPALLEALRNRSHHPSPLVREHVQWALAQHAAAPAGEPAA